MRRELRAAVLLVLAGAAVVLLSAGRAWVDLRLPQAPPLPPRAEVRRGSDLVAALSPLGLVGLAGVAALAATRGRGRVAVGVLLAVAGAGVVATTVSRLAGGALQALRTGSTAGQQVAADRSLGFTGWPWGAVAGGLLLAVGGLVVAVRGHRWAALSARYAAPAERVRSPSARPEVQAWDALDRGEDPTARPAEPEPFPAPSDRAPGDAAAGGPL